MKTIGALRERSRQAAARSDFGAAFRLSSEALAVAGADTKDPQRQQAKRELSAEVAKLAKLSNEKFRGAASNPSTLLIEK